MSASIDDGGPAFPLVAENGLGHVSHGMALRDYFAAKALQGCIAGAMADGAHLGKNDPGILARAAYLFADAMILARSA